MKRPCKNPSKNIAIFLEHEKLAFIFSPLMNVLVYMLKYDQSIHQGKIKKKKEHQHRTSNQQKYFQCKHALSTSHKKNNSNAQKLFDRQAQCNSFFLWLCSTIPPNNPLPRELIISKKHLLSVAHLSISLEQI